MPKSKIDTDKDDAAQAEYQQRMEYQPGDIEVMTPEEVAEMEMPPGDEDDDSEEG